MTARYDVLRDAQRTAIPWKNGGGLTREVAAFPAGASMAEFDWRISIADVAAAGPFSRFENVDRILTVLEGRLGLVGEDGARVDLAPLVPHRFAGNTAIEGLPVDGPVRDLNVMVRRGRWRAEVGRLDAGHGFVASADVTLIVAIVSQSIETGRDRHELAALDAILLEGAGQPIRVGGVSLGIGLRRTDG